jgi:hypothetical protein
LLYRWKNKVAVPTHLKAWIAQNRCFFPLLAFVIPLALRAIPEILIGPYIVGFDTMGYYVPNTLLWLHNGLNLGNFLATAPLFYTVFMSIVAVGGSPVLVLKIIPPLLLGFLSLSMYAYAKRGLGWPSSKSVFVALLGSIYFVALRASWDQLREELGLVFFFIVLMLLINRKGRSWKDYVVLSLTMMAVVLSHQLVSVLMFGVIIITVAYSLIRRDFIGSINVVVVSLPGMLYFLIVYLSGVLHAGVFNYSTNVGSPLESWTGFTSYQSMLISTGGLFIYCFLLILPLALISLWRLRNLQLGSWLLFSLILMLLPIASVSPYRWVLMLTFPLAFYATDSLSRLKLIKWKCCKFTIRRIAILYLVLSTAILSVGYILTTPEQPFVYFDPSKVNYYSNQIPSAMQQNTISKTDFESTINSLQWFKNNENGSSVLLTHTVFYGWAMLTLNESQIKNYEFDDPEHAAVLVAQEGRSQIYLIWWIPGQGWYEQPTLPFSFKELYHSGNIAIYQYVKTN